MKRYKNFKYKIKKKTVHIMEYVGNKDSLIKAVIPSAIDGLPVVFISFWTFKGCENLEEIEIPQLVTKIEVYAFCHTPKLKDVKIHKDNLVYSFQDGLLIENGYKLHTYLESNKQVFYTLPDNITEIGEMAFWGHKNLCSLSIPNTVKKIENSAFAFCDELTEIIIPDSVTEIGETAFAWCNKLEKVELTESLKVIPEGAFMFCEKLNNITIPLSVERIESEAFLWCGEYRMYLEAKILNPNTELSEKSFNKGSLRCHRNSKTHRSALKNKVKVTFFDQKIKSTVDPEYSNNSIENSVVTFCEGLNNIYIPDFSTEIGSFVIKGNNNLFELIIPSSVTYLRKRIFENNKKLKKIYIPESVTYIGKSAFAGCSNLIDITIAGAETILEEYAFEKNHNCIFHCKKDSFAYRYAIKHEIEVSCF